MIGGGSQSKFMSRREGWRSISADAQPLATKMKFEEVDYVY